MTATDQAEPAIARPLDDASFQASEFLEERTGEEVDPLLRGLERGRQPRFERAEIDAVGVVAQLLQTEAVGVRAEGIAVRTSAQHRVEHAIAAGVAVDHGNEVLDVPALDRRTRSPYLGGEQLVDELVVDEGGVAFHPHREEHKTGDDVVLGGLFGVEHRRRVVRDVAHRQVREGDVEMALLERRRRRQHDISVAGGLVEVDVDAHHRIERREGFVHLLGIRARQHRIAGDGKHHSELTLARLEDLDRQIGGGEFALDLGIGVDPALPTARAVGPPLLLGADPFDR